MTMKKMVMESKLELCEKALKATECELEFTEKKLIAAQARFENAMKLLCICGGVPLEEGGNYCKPCELLSESSTDALHAWFRERTEETKKALENLSKLGNEPLLGNSTGNVIAQNALTTLKKERGE